MSVKSLKKAANSTEKDKFENGTVVKFTSGGRYTYAAIKTPVGWYTTANNNTYVPNVISYEALLQIVARADVTNVEFATPEMFVKLD